MESVANQISFHPFNSENLKQMYLWLLKPYVSEWFANGYNITQDWVKEVFGNKNDFIHRWIFKINDINVGYIQNYFYKDDNEISNKYKNDIEIDNHSVGLDFFIGDENYIHRGYGKLILEQFLKNVVFTNRECNTVVVGPRPKNIASIKTLEANGFVWYKDVFDDKGRDEYMMILHR